MAELNLWAIVVAVIFFGGLLAFIIPKAIKAQRPRTASGIEELEGAIGVVRTTLNPEGFVLVKGELWNAVSEEDTIYVGESVCIKKVDGLKLYVTKLKKGGC